MSDCKDVYQVKWSILLELIPVSVATPLDGMLLHYRVTFDISSLVTIYTPGVKRATVSVMCLAQEHKAVSQPGVESRPLNLKFSALTIRSPLPPPSLPPPPPSEKMFCHIIMSLITCEHLHLHVFGSVKTVRLSHQPCTTPTNCIRRIFCL